MEGAGALCGIVAALVFGVGLWALASSWDRDRIAEYIKQRGGRVVSINWAPFGKGWFGEKEERIYEVVYYDKEGNQHFATCKTAAWTGVFWTDDRITHRKAKWHDSVAHENVPGNPLIGQLPKQADAAELANDIYQNKTSAPDEADEGDELERLRRENARLREQLERHGTTPDPGRCPACGAKIEPNAKRCSECAIALQ